jgi:hypothetical protein
MIHVILSLSALVALASAEVAWPILPDPIGLGPRLATIAWIQDRGVTLPADSTDRQILAWYADESGQNAEVREVLAQRHVQAYRRWQAGQAAADLARGTQAVATAIANGATTVVRADPPASPEEASSSPPPVTFRPLIARLDDRSDWAENYGRAPGAVRGGLAVKVYVKEDDQDNYYVMVSSTLGAANAHLLIDGVDYGPLILGSTASIQRLPCLSVGPVDTWPTVALQGMP